MTRCKSETSKRARLVLSLAFAPIVLAGAGCPSEPCRGKGCEGNTGSDSSSASAPGPEHYVTSVKCIPDYTDLKILFAVPIKDTYDGEIKFFPDKDEYHRADKVSAWWEFCNFTCGKDYDGSNPQMSYTFTVSSKSGTPVPSPVTKKIPALASGQCAHEVVVLQDGQGLSLPAGKYNFALSGVLNSTSSLWIVE